MKTPSPEDFAGKSYQTLKEEVLPILQELKQTNTKGEYPILF